MADIGGYTAVARGQRESKLLVIERQPAQTFVTGADRRDTIMGMLDDLVLLVADDCAAHFVAHRWKV
jgi:hypothetical protein